MRLLLSAIVAMFEPTSGDWRVLTDDPSNSIFAVETSSITGALSQRFMTAAVANRQTLEAGRYLMIRVAIDCHQQETTLVSVDVKSLSGELVETLNLNDLEATTASTSAGSPSAVALACDSVPVVTQSFESDVDFIRWATEHQTAH